MKRDLVIFDVYYQTVFVGQATASFDYESNPNEISVTLNPSSLLYSCGIDLKDNYFPSAPAAINSDIFSQIQNLIWSLISSLIVDANLASVKFVLRLESFVICVNNVKYQIIKSHTPLPSYIQAHNKQTGLIQEIPANCSLEDIPSFLNF